MRTVIPRGWRSPRSQRCVTGRVLAFRTHVRSGSGSTCDSNRRRSSVCGCELVQHCSCRISKVRSAQIVLCSRGETPADDLFCPACQIHCRLLPTHRCASDEFSALPLATSAAVDPTSQSFESVPPSRPRPRPRRPLSLNLHRRELKNLKNLHPRQIYRRVRLPTWRRAGCEDLASHSVCNSTLTCPPRVVPCLRPCAAVARRT